MKRLMILTTIVAALTTAYSGTDLENAIDAKNWDLAIKYVTWHDTKPINANNVSNLYNAAKAKNLTAKTQILAYKALECENTELFKEWLNSVQMTYTNHNWLGFTTYGLAWLDTNKESSALWVFSPIKNKYNAIGINKTHPQIMLPFYKARAAKGDTLAAMFAIQDTVCYNNKKSISWSISPHVTAEWKNFLKDTVTPTVFATQPDTLIVREFLDYLMLEYSPEVRDEFVTSDLLHTYVLNSKSLTYRQFGRKNYTRVFEAFMQYSTNLSIKIEAAAKLDKIRKNKNTSSSIWNYIIQNGEWTDKADLAIYLGDKDKVIDVFLTIDENATAKQLNSMIVVLNGLDREYRRTDVLAILKNVNSKYTLKLYNEREKWEPILSKVRAMIDVRED